MNPTPETEVPEPTEPLAPTQPSRPRLAAAFQKTNKLILRIASIVEVLAGITWIIVPTLVIPRVIGGQLAGAGIGLGRVAGFALVALGIACWPMPHVTRAAIAAMLAYNALVTAYLAFVAARYGLHGEMLVPSIVLHGILTLLLVFAWLKHQD